MKLIMFVVALFASACSDEVLIQGSPGPSGARGPQGARGPAGSAWAPKIEMVEESAGVQSAGEPVVALCPESFIVLGGGCRWGKSPVTTGMDAKPRVHAYESAPAEDGRGWVCRGILDPVGSTDEITAHAVCAEEP